MNRIMLDSINTVIYEITEKCNLQCRHCGYWRSGVAFCNISDFNEELAKLKDFGVKKILITGGEPLEHPMFSELVMCAKENHALSLKLATNGTLCNDAFIKTDFHKFDEIVVSLDAASADVYMDIRGRDCFNVLIDNIKKLVSAKLPNQSIKLSFLIQKKNFRFVADFIDIAVGLGVNHVALLVPNAKGDFQKKIIMKDYSESVFLSELEKKCFNDTVFPKLLSKFYEHRAFFLCSEHTLLLIKDYLLQDGDCFEIRKGTCSLPLNSVFIYANGRKKMCPYIDMELTEIGKEMLCTERMKLLFSAPMICRHCMEVSVNEFE